ncbi:protein ARABIDILLO 1 [Magnolia sinica]|uniref:protein ARABIDILLO 1 n=1 Tax=Magnolia sinica TaxID=86752 RepID=UPI002657B355|nr:protein ARABIDILLO 1 [Magnolia sinica]XP_058070829.1 protein ARABIDILLO 1 [Magnolia sinica]
MPSPSPAPPPPTHATDTLDLIRNHLLPLILLTTLSIKYFQGRWQLLRTKLTQLQSSLSSLYSSQNPLLQEHLLPNLLSTLQTIQSLSDQCLLPSLPCGKLLMQSNLDMASSSLSLHLHDLHLLLKSGVLLNPNSSAIVLSYPGPSSSKDDLGFFIRDLFTRLQIGSLEFKKKALDSLIQLLHDDDKNSVLVAKQGDVGYLIHLLDVNNQSSIREQAVAAVSVLASASESSRKIVFEEGGLGPLLRLLEIGSMPVKEKAAVAIEAITADPENAWAVSAYGGVPTLIDACRSGSPVMQMHASGAMRNVSVVEDVRVTMAEEGAIPVLVDLLISSGAVMQGNAAHCLWILASSGEEFRVCIVQEGGLQRLLQLVQEPPNPDTIEYALRAIYALLSSAPTAKALSSSTGFVSQLGELIKQGNVGLQQISASLICNLSLSDDRKRAISGCMATLVKMLELAKPVGMQDVAARALVSLLSVRSNRKDFVKEEKNVMRLVQMLDPKNEGVCKKYPISVVSALTAGGSGSCRKRLVAAGACQHLQVLADMDVAGAKKVLQRLAGSRLKNIFNRTWRE